VAAVVTQPDRARGRNLKVSPPVAKVLAASRGIPVYQPPDASSAESVAELRRYGADLFVVIAFGQILRKEALAVPKRYSVNLHGSLLPKYRGAAPTNWTILNGDAAGGVTIIKMNERMDEGDVISARETPLGPGETNITLNERLSELGAGLLMETLALIETGAERFIRQDASQASYAPKLRKEDGLIDWHRDAVIIQRRVRGLIPWPGAYTYYRGKAIKILGADVCECPVGAAADAGEVLGIIRSKGIIVKTGSGAVAITHLQLEGKKVLDADAFVRGHRIDKGDRFSTDG
jgi:methionyl-tRNA formyltransferase